ncbi:unnamed protein product [Acanthoscelides obtectus]|uniref:TOM1-like protein 2 n=1 Tax=Acanthoscelides obtectus TaxID=200917 RepID=A0A9P0LKV7_ACAOB|nr:unnamed protein product [Acanthoscelides obtectus]CAK1634934.1 TOM1-like protein 2 [Acanthoscelides obtectus]
MLDYSASHKIYKQATDGTLASENWALNMEICDLINETEDGARDAIKAIRKRLSQNAGKNYTVIMYTLIILETCVKNCGKRFHVLVCNKDFVQELVKLIGPKNDPPTAVQEKVLSLIQSWASAFQNQPEMSGVLSVYQDLLAKGIEFPATDLDSLAPIHTPKRSVAPKPVSEPPLPAPNQQFPQQQSVVGGMGDQEDEIGDLTPEQRAKLQSELDVVKSNMAVLGEMLSEVKPGEEQPDELEFLQELHSVCQQMQKRLVELINKLPNDDGQFQELLRCNDDLNNLFLRYSRWEKNREAFAKQSASSGIAAGPSPSKRAPASAGDSLIDFGDDVADKMGKLDLSASKKDAIMDKSKKESDEFDMFAQSRNTSYETAKKSGSNYKDNINPDQVAGGLSSVTEGRTFTSDDTDFDEIENWLGNGGKTTGGAEESVTSSDFERFLAERAAAVDNLPVISCTTNSTNAPSSEGTKDKKKTEAPLS